MADTAKPPVSISPLLLKLSNPTTTLYSIPGSEVAAAVALIFSDSVSDVQAGCLLYALHTTQLDRRPDVLAACAESMRGAAGEVDADGLGAVLKPKAAKMAQGAYDGGLVDIVGTGGDSHNTYNVSTTTSIVVSPLLLVGKHGNNASTSRSGSADLLLHASPAPSLSACGPKTLAEVYAASNYAFLYARDWHPGMRHAAAVRKELPFRTVFNLLGPLSNPLQSTGFLSSRVLGVAKRDMGPVFADALRLGGARRALVVCGAEDLDELSCAGESYCWLLRPGADGQTQVVPFVVSPEDLGLRRHPLAEVAGGKSPAENAEILRALLDGKLDLDGPIATFVLINSAALLAVSGLCEADEASDGGVVDKTVGPGGLRWKEGVRRAKWCITSGRASEEWARYVAATRAAEA